MGRMKGGVASYCPALSGERCVFAAIRHNSFYYRDRQTDRYVDLSIRI